MHAAAFTRPCLERSSFSDFCRRSLDAPDFNTKPLHKGQRGRIGVVGGSVEYTGAPYFAAISALNAGSDLVYVYCHAEAAIPIKCYSPELIVQPLFRKGRWDDEEMKDFAKKMARLDVVILGPGCGSSQDMQLLIEFVIKFTKEKEIPLICDADVFRLDSEKFVALVGHQKCILTPNVRELTLIESNYLPVIETAMEEGRKVPEMGVEVSVDLLGGGERAQWIERDGQTYVDPVSDWQERAAKVARLMRGPLVFLKAPSDLITNGRQVIVGNVKGTRRRCGGQGDVLAGVLGAFVGFLAASGRLPESFGYEETLIPVYNNIHGKRVDLELPSLMLVAALASLAVRRCAAVTEWKIDYLTTTKLLEFVGPVVSEMIESGV